MGKLLDTMLQMLPKMKKEDIKTLKFAVDKVYNKLFPEEIKQIEEIIKTSETVVKLSEENIESCVNPIQITNVVNDTNVNNGKVNDTVVVENVNEILKTEFSKLEEVGNNSENDEEFYSDEELIEKFGYLPSKYQKAIIKWVKNGKNNAIIGAVAGSGKSTSLRMVAKILEESGANIEDIRVLVFGKQNSLDLIAKFGDSWKNSVSTLHSCGWNLIKQELRIKKAEVTAWKYKNIAKEIGLVMPDGSGLLKSQEVCEDMEFFKLVDLVRLTNQKPTTENITSLITLYGLENVYHYHLTSRYVQEILNEGEFQAEDKNIFDFVDQIWLPVKWELNKKRWFKPYEFVLCDEVQDLNALQMEILKMLVGNTGRLLAVGDGFQSIMSFAGASHDSFEQVKKFFNAHEMPLSVCYRCPKSHIRLVNEYFPEIKIEAAENAKEGEIWKIKENQLENMVKTGDLIISRKTAPLVNQCIKLIAKGLPAKVKGKDIGQQIKKDIEDIGKLPKFTYDKFNEFAQTYTRIKLARFKGLPNVEELTEAFLDKMEAIKTIYESQINAISIKDLGDYIDTLFSDDNAPITLQSGHRSKGTEAERVFIKNPEHSPFTHKNQQPWQYQQEKNLLYVMMTRSKDSLFIVTDDKHPQWLGNTQYLPEKVKNVKESLSFNIGDIVQVPDGKVGKISYINDGKATIGLVTGAANYHFDSLKLISKAS